MKLSKKTLGFLVAVMVLGPVGTVFAASADLVPEYNKAVLRPHIARYSAAGVIEKYNVGTGFNGNVYTMVRQPDGKLLVGGEFSEFDGISRNGIARLNADGTLDDSFNVGNGFTWFNSSGTGRVRALALSGSDILVGGSFNTFNGVKRNNIARLRADGALDPSFNPGTGFDAEVTAVLRMGAKGLVVGGDFTSYNGVSRNHIAGLEPTGQLQAGFNPGAGFTNGGFNPAVSALLLDATGNILVGGKFRSYDGAFNQNILRLRLNGTIDPTFNAGIGFNDQVLALALDGTRVVVGGYFTSYNGTNRNYLARIFSNGDLDQGFTVGFNSGLGAVSALAMDGADVLVGGEFTHSGGTSYANLVRVHGNGSLGAAFEPVLSSTILAIVADGKVTVGGTFTTDLSTGFNDRVTSMLRQPDGKLIVGGFFTSYRGVSRNHIARLNADSSLDPTFNPGSGFNGYVNALALNGDKVLVGGFFTSYNGVNSNYLARLNADGKLDATFAAGTNFNPGGGVSALAADNAGVYVGGIFSSYNGVGRNNIVRLKLDGSLDAGFNPGTGFNSDVTSLALYGSDVYVGGFFTSYNGINRSRIARLNSDGSLDTAFNPGTGFDGSVSTLAVSGNTVYAGGWFTSYDGLSNPHLVRLKETGKIDPSFQTNGVADAITAILVDGTKVYVGGWGWFYTGTTFMAGIARLQDNGTFDPSFQPSPGFNRAVFSLAKDGEDVIVGGDFSTYNGQGAVRIAKLTGS